ncbi:MAG: transglutaminase-like domain-containing protein [Nitrospira sp.]
MRKAVSTSMAEFSQYPDRLPDHQVRALVQLLADENTHVAETVRAQLLALGTRAIPYLHGIPEHRNPVLREEADKMITCIRLEEAAQQFEVFLEGDIHLEEGAFLLARMAYPDLDVQAYRQDLDGMAKTLSERLPAGGDGDATLRIVNHYLFVDLAFRGNTEDYTNPENSYIHRVLARKLGIPISLSAVCLFIGRRLGLPFFGVGLPGHFIVSYRGDLNPLFIDPFNAGQILTREQCMQFITRTGQHWHEDYLSVTADREILARMIRNLVASYTRLGETTLAERLSRCLKRHGHEDGA